MKFGITQQRVLFGMLFGALALNAAWFQQLSSDASNTNLASSGTPCVGIERGNACERTVTIETTETAENGKTKKSSKDLTYTYRLVPKKIPGGKNLLTNQDEADTAAVAIEIGRHDCRSCTVTLPTSYTLEEAKNMGVNLITVAQKAIDKMADEEAASMKKKVEVAKRNLEEEKKEAKKEKDREACRIGGDDDKKLVGFEIVECLAEKIPGIDDPAKRAAAFAAIQPQLRDMLISGNEADKTKARALLTQMASAENGPQVSQTAKAMLTGDRFETQAEGIIGQLAGIQRRMTGTRRGSQQYNTLLSQKTKLESKLKNLSSQVSNDLEAAAERAGDKATPSSVAEANFWVDRLNDNMAYALRDPRSALATLQGRDTLGGRTGTIASGDLDALETDSRRRVGSRNGRFDDRAEGGTYSSQPPRGSARQYNRGGNQFGYNNRRGPVYAQGRYNGRADYDYDYVEDDGSFLEFPNEYTGSYNGGGNRYNRYNRYNGGGYYPQQQRGLRRRF